MRNPPVTVACFLAVLATSQRALADDADGANDPVAGIAASVPATWKVSLVSGLHEAIVRIETDPMEVVPPATSSGAGPTPGERRPVVIEFKVLPKYSPAMLKRIRVHNEPILARLDKVHPRSAEWINLKADLIPYPLFQDQHYGYVVVVPSRVPRRGEDHQLIERVLARACAGWKPVDKGGRVVGKIMSYFSPG